MGIAYTSSSSMNFSGNQFFVDFSALGLGKVNYDNLSITGQRQPQEFGLGVSFQVNKQFLVALEGNWIDWSSALNASNLSATNPDNLLAPPNISIDIVDGWHDQWVWSTGIVYETLSGMVVRGGFNYGRNPIPDTSLNPLLAAIIERHLTFGVGFKLDNKWQLNSGLQWEFKNSAISSSISNPTGGGSVESSTAISIILSISNRW